MTNHKEEVELLKKESEIPLEDLLKDLPADYLEDRSKSLSPTSKETTANVSLQVSFHNKYSNYTKLSAIKDYFHTFFKQENEKTADGDADFVAASDESSDEEDTIMEQEKQEENADYKQELDDLKVYTCALYITKANNDLPLHRFNFFRLKMKCRLTILWPNMVISRMSQWMLIKSKVRNINLEQIGFFRIIFTFR